MTNLLGMPHTSGTNHKTLNYNAIHGRMFGIAFNQDKIQDKHSFNDKRGAISQIFTDGHSLV